MEDFNRFCLPRKKKMCELCKKGYARVEHYLEDYEGVKRSGISIEVLLHERGNKKAVA